jgi:hypothetical protein
VVLGVVVALGVEVVATGGDGRVAIGVVVVVVWWWQ